MFGSRCITNFLGIDLDNPKVEFLIIDKDDTPTDSIRFYNKDDVFKDLQPLYQVAKASATNLQEKLNNLQNSLDSL